MAEVEASEVPQHEKNELFCTYAAMILADSELEVTEESINKLIKTAGGSVDSFWPPLFAKMLQGKDISDYLKFGGGGGGVAVAAAAAPAAGGGGGGAAAAKEEKKVEEEEEEEEMDFDLFG
eukprot:CAMPEP_0178408788 /NCGR_PEP_ID=MMETSP0689_2-20121128/20123_1 /TAXON_ID=160604 /ORGANISM="Amphidinium massartii, Strain CS-259" /LENGTH=120 /DNA_ID=CAMNT_0020029901 /DNA_START=72 /DNA_END=434 /DNA_ORIENTATION=+